MLQSNAALKSEIGRSELSETGQDGL